MNDLMTKSFMDSVDLKRKTMKDLESGPDPEMDPARTDENLTAFLEEVEEVKKELNSIKEILARIQASNEPPHEPVALSVLKRAWAIQTQLEEMDRVNAVNKRLSGCYTGSPLDRARTALANWLRKKLKDMMMMEFQAMWQKDTIQRRYFTVTGDFPGDDGEEILARAMQEHERGKAVETAAETKHRYDAAAVIERSLLELHQIIMYMKVVVAAQGEKINDIEHHMNTAAEYTYDGTKNFGVASNKQHQKSRRRCLLIGIILLLLLILLPLIVVSIAFWDHLFHHFEKTLPPPPPQPSQPK